MAEAMTTEWTCTIPGRPRTKNAKRAFGGRVFDDAATKEAEANARAVMTLQRPQEPFCGPVVQDVVFCFAIPKSRSRDVKHRDGTITKALQPGDLHDARPDRGNMLKLLDDALVGARVVLDDAQLADGRVRKEWGIVDETRVTVRAWGGGV